MKCFKYLLIGTLSTLLLFTGCKKDRTTEDRPNTNINLVGKWVMIASYQDDGTHGYWSEVGDENPPQTMEFTSDGKFTNSDFSFSTTYTLGEPGQLTIIIEDGELQPYKYYATKAGELVIHPSGGKYACYDGYGCSRKYKRIE